jgi:hypothetical protein
MIKVNICCPHMVKIRLINCPGLYELLQRTCKFVGKTGMLNKLVGLNMCSLFGQVTRSDARDNGNERSILV